MRTRKWNVRQYTLCWRWCWCWRKQIKADILGCSNWEGTVCCSELELQVLLLLLLLLLVLLLLWWLYEQNVQQTVQTQEYQSWI